MDKLKLASHIATNYPTQYNLLIDGGKLVFDWNNVVEHCLMEAAVMEIVAPLLGLDKKTTERLVRNAVCDNWDKRLLKCPDDFTDTEKKFAADFSEAAGIDEELLAALNPRFLPIVMNGQATFLQLVAFLVDDMTMGDKFVTFDERVAEVSARNPNPDPEVDMALGIPYWEAERLVGHRVEAVFCAIFSARMQMLAQPELLVRYVNAVLDERFPD